MLSTGFGAGTVYRMAVRKTRYYGISLMSHSLSPKKKLLRYRMLHIWRYEKFKKITSLKEVELQ
jgi:hypothetical protein